MLEKFEILYLRQCRGKNQLELENPKSLITFDSFNKPSQAGTFVGL